MLEIVWTVLAFVTLGVVQFFGHLALKNQEESIKLMAERNELERSTLAASRRIAEALEYIAYQKTNYTISK